jgi:hypothetical protein
MPINFEKTRADLYQGHRLMRYPPSAD